MCVSMHVCMYVYTLVIRIIVRSFENTEQQSNLEVGLLNTIKCDQIHTNDDVEFGHTYSNSLAWAYVQQCRTSKSDLSTTTKCD